MVLEGGRIVESGSYRELVGREGSRFRALMAAQLSATVVEQEPEKDEEADWEPVEFEEIVDSIEEKEQKKN